MLYTEINFKIDLVSAALNHLQFLEECDNPILRDEGILRQALHRYQHFWLPLAAKYYNKILEAPLDVAWVWHCHMLSPAAYCADCIRLLDGKIVDHTLDRNAKSKAQVLDETRELWNKEFPNEPFEVELNPSLVNPKYRNGGTDFSYNILEAAGRQKEFGYQVSLPHYRDKKFLESSLVRYKKFLVLKLEKPKMFIVPCYDIDLLWHTHQLYPLLYKEDTEKLFGKIFNHDDSVTDRNEGSKLFNADLATREAWKEVFNENFALFGAMYRGENPLGKLYGMKTEEVTALRTKSANLVFERVEIRSSPNIAGKPRLRIFTGVNTKQSQIMATLKGSNKVWQEKSLFNVNFDTRSVNCIIFSLQECTGWACLGTKTTVAETSFDMLPVLDSVPFHHNVTQELSTILPGNLQIDFKVNINQPKPGPILLYLKAGHYERAVMPEHLENLWGPIPLPRLPPGTDNWCEVASHKVINHRGAVMFTCRLIHSQPLLQSAVHVFYQDKMVAVGHLVGTDQIPIPTQVANRSGCVTLNPRAGERAVLIKNHKGDWALAVGRWTGYKRGVPGIAGTRNQKGRKGVPGSPGTLHLKIWTMSERAMKEMKLSYDSNIYSMRLQGALVDLKAGLISVDESCDNVAESLALAFSIALLHVLCQPRPQGWEPGQSMQPAEPARGARRINYVPSEDLAFVMAAGFLMATPSNFYVREHYGDHACAGCGGGGGDIVVNDFTGVDCGSIGGGDVGGG
ncbi:unnamed protein product, partial [Lymnaea stagnalis]